MERTKVVEYCKGCYKSDGEFCSVYQYPEKKVRLTCHFNYMNHPEEAWQQGVNAKVRVGQQKTKRRNR